MSVTNYTPEKCRYLVEKLVKTVFLISEDAVKDIRIDNGDAYINSVSESPIKIDCYSINLQEEESLDERYRFTHTLTFSVNGYANSDDFQGRFYAIVKDNEGTYWLVNPLFPCKVTYTYTLGYNQSHTDFTMATVSNHPVLRLHNFGDATPYECQEYFLDGIDALWLNEKRYTVHDGNSVKYTNDGFKTIEYNQRAATFTETFDGTNTSHQIDFDILFSQYKSSWHYNLLEFKDNLYSAVFKTRNNKYALCGFSFGLQPSFKINADDTIQGADKIQITLQDAHDVGDPIEFFDSIDYEYLSARTYVYTSEYDGYECVGEGVARYLLQKEVDALGNETGNYKALEGYTGRFPGLNIVGTFSNIETFPHSECRVEPCRLSTSLPDRIVFNEVGSKVYTLKAGSDWTITHNQGISVSPESGTAGVSYTITVYNPVTPTATAWTTNLVVHYCNGQEHSSTVTVVADEDSCFQNGSVYNISANEQTLTIPTLCCVQKVSERTGVGVVANIYSSYLTVYVPQNNSGIERTIILLVEFCDGSAANITINQSNLFESWVDDHTICVGRSKYMVQYKYTGTSPDHCDTRTDETRTVLIETESEDCIYEYRWVLSDQTDCVDYDEYYLYQRQVRVIDSLDPWENVVPAEYSIDGYGTMERVLFKKKSVNCGWVNYAMYRWVDTDDGECFEVKECEDYDQLNVPVNIRDGIVVDNNVSSVYNVSTSTTGRVYSNVGEILLGSDLVFNAQANEVVGANTGLTIGNDVTSNYFTKNVTGRTVVTDARYQALVGCGIEHMIIYTNKFDGEGTHLSPVRSFVYLLKDTPLDSYSFDGSTVPERVKIYVQDWAINLLRGEYIPKGTGSTESERENEHPILLPITDNPVPIVLTEYSSETSSYVCHGSDKYAIYNVIDPSGTTIATGETLYETGSTDCQVDFLTFEAITDCQFSFETTQRSGSSVSYSLDGGENWTDSTATTTTTPLISSGGTVMWKATGIGNNNGSVGKFTCGYSDRFNVLGNVESMLSNRQNTSGYYIFSELFKNCNIVSAESIVIPESTIGSYSYSNMFAGCGYLTKVPNSLPATNLGNASFCYSAMFAGCGSLTDASNLKISASTLSQGCCYSMFWYCGRLTTAPSLPAATLSVQCYRYMFSGCTALTTAPELPAATLAEKCYRVMFNGCSLINNITCLATNNSAASCTASWVGGVAASGTFTKAASMSGWGTGISAIPSGWTVQDYNG